MARRVRVAAFTNILDKKPRTMADNLDWTCGVLDEMACERPDVVCLTENFDSCDTGLKHAEMAQCLDEPTFTRMAQKARDLHCYIICAFIEKRGNRFFNTAAVIGRNGELAGHYDKIHPTNWEIESGVRPGTPTPSVITTDFGKIGCQICFDANWPEDWRALKEAGAEIILFPSAFSGGRILESLATVYHVPIVAACYRQCCRIVDRDGLVLNRQGVYQRWVSAELDLDNPLFHLDFQFDKVEAIRKEYGPDVILRVYEEEGWWRVVPRRPDLDILDIIRKFELERLEDYLARSAAVQDGARPVAE
jgi:predicted amidohydrolase